MFSLSQIKVPADVDSRGGTLLLLVLSFCRTQIRGTCYEWNSFHFTGIYIWPSVTGRLLSPQHCCFLDNQRFTWLWSLGVLRTAQEQTCHQKCTSLGDFNPYNQDFSSFLFSLLKLFSHWYLLFLASLNLLTPWGHHSLPGESFSETRNSSCWTLLPTESAALMNM